MLCVVLLLETSTALIRYGSGLFACIVCCRWMVLQLRCPELNVNIKTKARRSSSPLAFFLQEQKERLVPHALTPKSFGNGSMVGIVLVGTSSRSYQPHFPLHPDRPDACSDMHSKLSDSVGLEIVSGFVSTCCHRVPSILTMVDAVFAFCDRQTKCLGEVRQFFWFGLRTPFCEKSTVQTTLCEVSTTLGAMEIGSSISWSHPQAVYLCGLA